MKIKNDQIHAAINKIKSLDPVSAALLGVLITVFIIVGLALLGVIPA